MGVVKEIKDEAQFQEELTGSSSKLLVVDFTAVWCGPCQRIAPIYEQLAQKYDKASFVKVDVDKCQEVAANQRVSSMPTFYFFRNKVKVDSLSGADATKLEEKIKKYYDGEGSEEDVGVAGHMDLNTFIQKNDCEALNESDQHTLQQCLTSNEGYLESDCDEQLIISLAFNQAVKIHSLRIKGPTESGPKSIRLFINQTNTLDFDAAAANNAVQEIEISEKELNGELISLKYVKFQNVQNIQLFIKDNQSGSETTRIDHLQIIGSPISTTNMGDFKRIAGFNSEPDSIKALEEAWREKIAEGNSLAAVLNQPDASEPKVVGANITYVVEGTEEEFPEVGGTAIRTIGKVLHQITEACDVGKKCGVNKYLSAMGLGVDSEYHGLGIGEILLKSRKELCRRLDLTCSATVFTGVISQHLASKAGFETIYEVKYNDIIVNDKHVFSAAPSDLHLKLMARTYEF